MPNTMTLVQYPGLTRNRTLSPPCGKARMALAFKGLDYETRNVRLPAQIKRYNSRGRVPVLLIGDEIVVDSTDILDALDQRHPDPPLEPTDPAARAQARILEDWADEALYFYGVYFRWCHPPNYARMREHVLNRLPIPFRWIAPLIARRRVRTRTLGQGVGLKDEATVRRELQTCLQSIETLLSFQPYLVGERISRADLAVAAVLDQVHLELLTPDCAAEIDRHPQISTWLERLHRQVPNQAEPEGS